MLSGKKSSGKIERRDVLIGEYEKDGEWYIYSRPATYWRPQGRGDLYVQSYDQEETHRADPGKQLRGLQLDQLIGTVHGLDRLSQQAAPTLPTRAPGIKY